MLRFGQGHRLSRYAHNAFVGKLPRIEVIGWTPNLANKYLIVVESDRERRAVSEPLYGVKESFQLDLVAPSKGTIYVEPKGRSPVGFVASALHYTLLPSASLTWPEGLHESEEEVSILVSPAEKLSVEWEQKEISPVSGGRWSVPTQVEFVEGLAKYEGDFSFSVSGPICRLKFEGDCIDQSVLWRDVLKAPSILRVTLSAAEIEKHVDIGIFCNDSFLHVAQTPPVGSNREIILKSDSIRDALESPNVPVGLLAVRLQNGTIVRSQVACLSEQQVIDYFSDPEEQDLWLDALPGNLRLAIEAVKRLHFEQEEMALPSDLRLPPTVISILLEYQICNSVLDCGGGREYLPSLESGILYDILTWYLEASDFLLSGRFVPHLAGALLEREPKDVSPLRIERWRSHVKETARRLSEIIRFLDSIREWSALCKTENWRQAKQSAIGRMVGGEILTDAASDYFYLMERRVSNKELKASTGLKRKLDTIASRGGIVGGIASVLQSMVFYHLRGPSNEEFIQRANVLVEQLGNEWAGVRGTLKRICGISSSEYIPDDSIALSDISPHVCDSILEETINER